MVCQAKRGGWLVGLSIVSVLPVCLFWGAMRGALVKVRLAGVGKEAFVSELCAKESTSICCSRTFVRSLFVALGYGSRSWLLLPRVSG